MDSVQKAFDALHPFGWRRMTGSEFRIRYFHLVIHDLDGQFIVAKLRRVTSPPVRVGSVRDSLASAFGRLADILRLGRESRNYADLRAMDAFLRDVMHTTADEEWTKYIQVVCRAQEGQAFRDFVELGPGDLLHDHHHYDCRTCQHPG